uniref:Uncharacterized protein n=1 Tax=Arundo donax TaxID=35708 RepID=A0A0A9ASP1_ARUDO
MRVPFCFVLYSATTGLRRELCRVGGPEA